MKTLKKLKVIGYIVYTKDKKKIELSPKNWEELAEEIRNNPQHLMRNKIETVEEKVATVDDYYTLAGEQIAKPLPENWTYKKIPVCRYTNEGELVVKNYEKEVIDKKGRVEIIRKPYQYVFNEETQQFEIET